MTRTININLIFTLIFFTLLNLSCDNNSQGFNYEEDDDPYSYSLNINLNVVPGECEGDGCSYDNQIDYNDLNYLASLKIVDDIIFNNSINILKNINSIFLIYTNNVYSIHNLTKTTTSKLYNKKTKRKTI